MKNKILRKQLIFSLVTFVTFCWIIFYSFIHHPSKNLVIYFTYQSNFLVWLYYSFWMISFLIFKYFENSKYLTIMNHRGFNHFIGSTIALTSFIAVFLLGPFELLYNVYFSSLSTNIPLLQHLFIIYNSFMLHFLIPVIVVYDLINDYHDNVEKKYSPTYLIGFFYLIFYLIAIEIYGSISGIYPYTPLDPNSFESWFGIFMAVISPFIGITVYLFISYFFIVQIAKRSSYGKYRYFKYESK